MKSLIGRMSVIFAVLYMITYTTPFFRYFLGSNFRIVGLAFLMTWIVLALLAHGFRTISKFTGIILINILIFVFFALAGIGNVSSIIAGYVAFWSFLIITEFYIQKNDTLSIRYLTVIMLIAISVTTVTTIFASMRFPNISKIRNTDSISGLSGNDLMYRLNAGGFDYIAGVSILAPAILLKFKKQKGLFLLIPFILFTVSIFISGYTIATLVYFIGVALVLLADKKGTIRGVRVLSLILILFVVVFFFVESDFVIQFVEGFNEHLASRLLEFQSFFKGDLGEESDMGYRMELTRRSLNTFANHPFWGAGPYYFAGTEKIGNHSQIIDDLARFGICGGLFYIVCIFYFSQWLKRIRRISGQTFSLVIPYLLFLILSMVNPTLILPILGLVLFLVIPGLYYI